MKLTKIKLINWHIFSNRTIDVKGNTLITGENASGKSTLMDAIYYVLSGGDETNFNKAANQGGERTLESYLRGKLGTEQNKYLRSGKDVIGYIGLEFTSNDYKNSKTILAGMEILDSGKLKSKFYILPNYKINDCDFIKDNKIRYIKELEEHMKLSNIQMDYLGISKRDVQNKIARDTFKLLNPRRYLDLLKNAISFRPIEEVSTFVNCFLLKEDNINLDSLRNEIRGYQEIKSLLYKEQSKIDALGNFIEKAKKYKENLEEIEYLTVLQADSEISIKENKNRLLENENIKIETNINESDSKISEIEQKISDCQNEQYILKNNEQYIVLREKNECKKKYQEEVSTLDYKISEIRQIISKEKERMEELKLNYNLESNFTIEGFTEFKVEVNSYLKAIEEIHSGAYDSKSKAEINSKEILDQITSKNNELTALRQGNPEYRAEVKDLITALTTRLNNKYKDENPVVKPLCEYLEIIDESWRNALEGYLDRQKFTIIVNPKYYDDCALTYEKLNKDHKIYGVGLLNVNDLREVKPIENSLYSKLEIENKNADLYARLILGNVKCVDNVIAAKGNKIAITKDVMIYKNAVLSACDPRRYNKPFIGKDSRMRRIELLVEEISKLDDKYKTLQNSIANNKKIIEITNDTSSLKLLVHSNNILSEFAIKEKRLNEIITEIKDLQERNGVVEIAERIRNLDLVISNNRNKKDNLIKLRDNLIANKSKNVYEIKNNNEFLEEKLAYRASLIDKLNPEKYLEYTNKYTYNQSLSAKRIEEDLESDKKTNNANSIHIVNGMREYANHYKPSLFADISSIDDFIAEYNTVYSRGIIEFKSQANEAYNRALKSFDENFIVRIREKINEGISTLKKINKSLALHKFGTENEIYEFTYNPAKNNDFSDYYRIITSGKNFEQDGFFVEGLDEKDKLIINDLFERISQEPDSNEKEKELGRYLDYRNYMYYDIKIKNSNGDTAYFSKIHKEKSGGETQTPFYVIIAACFEQLLNKDNKGGESTATVVLDEAFNNMDEGRIKSLMEFYKELNIQLLIVVPSVRMHTIAPYVDRVLGICKRNNNGMIIPMHE